MREGCPARRQPWAIPWFLGPTLAPTCPCPLQSSNPVPPSSYLCPVCWELMADPVVLDTGHSYDRPCIERWLFQQNNRTCPVTGQRLNHLELIPNHALRIAIEVGGAQRALLRLGPPQPDVPWPPACRSGPSRTR